MKEDQVEEFKIVMKTRKVESDNDRTNGNNHFFPLVVLLANF